MNYGLSVDERDSFIQLINRFAEAKQNRDFLVSDQLRKELAEWQQGIGDAEWVEMASVGRYVWHAVLETQGTHGHRYKRLSSRLSA